jgi:apolipoprotein N-acyltransferase
MIKAMRRLFLLFWPLALGAVSVFGFAPYGHFWLPVLTLALLFMRVRVVSPRMAFAQGYLFGLGFFLAGVSWVFVSLHTFGQLPWPLAGLATFLFCAFLALFPAAALGLAARLTAHPALRLLVTAPAFWMLFEWLRGWIFTGFPWLAMGYAQAPDSPLAAFAPLLGVYGLSLLTALAAGAIALRNRLGLMTLLGLGLVSWGAQQPDWTAPTGAPVTVSLVQGNVAQDLKFQPGRLETTLLDYLRLVQGAHGRLTILPETALPLFWHDVPLSYQTALADAARARGGDAVVGVPTLNADGRYFNSVLSTGRAPQQGFHKVHLVPFGEFVPPGFRWLVEQMQIPLGDFSRGATAQAPLAVAGQQVAMNICYEDVFGEELIHALPQATLMANVSNDAWFGDTAAPWQHLQIAQMRALETGRVWLRANNTGITAVINEAGQVAAQLPPFTQGVLEATVQGRSGLTPFARWGNVPALMLALLMLAFTAWHGLRRPRLR